MRQRGGKATQAHCQEVRLTPPNHPPRERERIALGSTVFFYDTVGSPLLEN